jgi:hypothetical protein
MSNWDESKENIEPSLLDDPSSKTFTQGYSIDSEISNQTKYYLNADWLLYRNDSRYIRVWIVYMSIFLITFSWILG